MPWTGRIILACLALALVYTVARADGGAVRLDQQSGGYRIVVFTQPTPLRAGVIDLSVLVQDAQTGRSLPQATVTVELSRDHDHNLHLRSRATRAAATNKLLRAARFELPISGSYSVNIDVDGPHGTTRVQLDLDVAGPMPRWLSLWPWLFWPAVPIGLFVMQSMSHDRRYQRKTRREGESSALAMHLGGDD